MKNQIGIIPNPNQEPSRIIAALRAHQIVTVPTETVEGYAVSLMSEEAIVRLMNLKERDFDSDKIFTLVPENTDAIAKYATIPDIVKPLIAKYFPGELTIILPKNPDFHNFYYDHYDTIGLRIPKHPLFPTILAEIGPIILTSANLRGGTPRTTTGHLPSTILDFTKETPKILRQGNLIISF